ncbi:MAG: ATP12 family protein [Maritimibacter sp.]
MSDWQPKRFWKLADVAEADGGYSVELDGRPVRTPSKALLVMPSRAMAEAVAAEWNAQEEKLRPDTMPLTRTMNSAIDKVMPQKAEVAALLAAYGETDLICHRADQPAGLVARQAEGWDPLLDWAEEFLGARLVPVAGIIAADQDATALARLADQVLALDVYRLAAFHDLVSLTGSLVLGFAALHDLRPAEDLWNLSRIDEDWQVEKWGHDDEADAHTLLKKQAFLDAALIVSLLACD